ncbi:MAG: outer membrane lipoprotein-sorting protein [Gammaproteobacteria bacterium]|nr:outer membrane lipoprotein-sorting protein [Gammaproteobacteria bacterium]
MNFFKLPVFIFTIFIPLLSSASIKNLPYPKSPPSAAEIAQQNQFVDKFYGFSRMPSTHQPSGRAILVTRSVGEPLSTTLAERYINTNTSNTIASMELGSFLSGKHNSMTFLITHYEDDRAPSFQVWRPDLRKVRRIPAPLYDDRLAGSDFTWGDMILHRPEFENHKVIKQQVFNRCLSTIETKTDTKWMPNLPQASCHQKKRPVYILKSFSKGSPIKEYDYRIRFIDTETFADYRTEFYKDDILIRVVEKNWGPMGMEDPRVQAWSYMYANDLQNDHESMFIQLDRNTTMKPNGKNFWSENTLRKVNR